MNSTFKLLGFGTSIVLSTLIAGCSTGSDDGTGGTSGTSGGASGTSGGAANKGGSSTTSGGAAGVTKLYTFDAEGDPLGFELNKTASTDPMYTNLGSGTPLPIVAWTGTNDFDPAATTKGCLLVKATFTGWNQSVTAEAKGPYDKVGNPIDLTAKTLRAQVYLEKGLSPFTASDAPGGVVFFIKSGTNYAWGQAPWTNLTTYGSWTVVKFNTENPDPGSTAGWDPSNPVQIGFQISSGGGNTHTAAEFGDPLETVVCIDNITVQDN
ncbi:MAG: hypothetical protein QM756_45245 [Polyangiaceae bacterium]